MGVCQERKGKVWSFLNILQYFKIKNI